MAYLFWELVLRYAGKFCLISFIVLRRDDQTISSFSG